ncbi:MAG: hypothetical protein KQI62_02685 [Deltaproteobacteria bacterium]|nr:hypothetical protein [Deltaproteobacteria bacterium]
MKRATILIGVAMLVLGLSAGALAHSPICTCYDNGDGSISCEGGFSDGSSAAGVNMYVKQGDKELLKGAMNADSEFTFKKPKGDYKVVFDAGEGHQVIIQGKDIVE